MRAGRLRVLVHRASCSDLPKDNLDFFCAVEACNYGKLYTESKCADDLHWDEELTFHIGPDATDDSGPGAKLSVCLYAAPPDSDDKQLLGMGSMRIEGIEEGDGKREIVLPLVNHLGKHSGEVHLSARFFSSRTPGRSLHCTQTLL